MPLRRLAGMYTQGRFIPLASLDSGVRRNDDPFGERCELVSEGDGLLIDDQFLEGERHNLDAAAENCKIREEKVERRPQERATRPHRRFPLRMAGLAFSTFSFLPSPALVRLRRTRATVLV